jgi:single-strand DNA-binding protein
VPAEGKPVGKVGNVSREPELRFSEAGKAYCKFGLAVNPWAPPGEEKPPAQFYDVTCFGSLAEHVAETLKKGYRVVVVGFGKIETWTGRDNLPHESKVIIADGVGPDLRFVSADVHQEPRRQAAPAAAPEAFSYDDELPF